MRTTERICVFLCLWTAAAVAQTNAPQPVKTAAPSVRTLSLQDCVQLALKHNFDVQIVRLSPDVARYNLKAASGAHYDPVFSIGAKREYLKEAPATDVRNDNPDNPYDMSETAFETTVSGRGWPGFSYELGGSTSELDGETVLMQPPNPAEGLTPLWVVNGVPWTDTTVQYVPDPNIPWIVNRVVTRHAQLFKYHTAQAGLTMKQSLLKDFWIDSGRMQIQIRKKDLQISEHAFRRQLMATVLMVQQAYYDLAYAHANMKVMQRSLELAKELLEGERKRIAAQLVPPLSEKLAESRVQTSEADLLAAQEMVETRGNALRGLISDDYLNRPDDVIVPSDALVVVRSNPSRSESFQTAMKQRPEMAEARLLLEKQDVIVKFQHNQTLPQVDLVGGVGAAAVEDQWGEAFNRLGDGAYPYYSVGVVLNYPIGNVAARNKYKAARQLKEQAALNVKKVEQTIFVQVDNSLKILDRTYQRTLATRKATEYAEAALNAEKQKLADGTSTSFLVSEYERNYVSARSSEILATADYNKALAQLAFEEGTILDKNQIKLDVK